MKDQILASLDSPAQLERLYRSDKRSFKRAFNAVSGEIKDSSVSDFWHQRLNFANEELAWGSAADKWFLVSAVILAGVIAKFPAILELDVEFFYPRNVGFIIFPLLTAFFAWKNKLSTGSIAFAAGATLAGLIFINLLPNDSKSDTLALSCVHLVLYLWCIFGFAFAGGTGRDDEGRLGFLRYNGEWIVMTGLILIAGGILTAVTIGLFSIIGLNIEKFYFEYIAIPAAAAVPIVGSFITRANPQLTGRVSPAIARIFSPVVLVMLVAYLVAIIYSGKDPYRDREFLLVFNALLVGVMAIIFFSLAGTSRTTESRSVIAVLFLLSFLTIIVNGIALSAIVFRISEWGISPNRLAVLGGNVLILINLLMVTRQLVMVLSRRKQLSAVGGAIVSYLPVYFFWTIVVTFLFPVIFGFR